MPAKKKVVTKKTTKANNEVIDVPAVIVETAKDKAIETFRKSLPSSIEDRIVYVRSEFEASGRAMMEAGGALVTLHVDMSSNEFAAMLETIGIGRSTAYNMMRMARSFVQAHGRMGYLDSSKITLMIEAGLSDEDYDPAEDTIGGHPIDEIDKMSFRDLRAKLRNEKKKTKALGRDNIDMELKLAQAERAAHPIPNRYEDALEAAIKMRKHTILALGAPHPFLDNPKVDEAIGRLFFEALTGMATDIVNAMQYFATQEHIKPFDMGHLDIKDSLNFLKDYGITEKDFDITDKDLGIE